MARYFNILITALLTVSSLSAQTDPKAKAILDKLSAKSKSYSTIKADFSYTLENKAEDFSETQSGAIAISGEKYYLKIAGQEIMSDGKMRWTYLKDANEVQISEVDPDDNDAISPTNIFTMYENGYKQQFSKDMVLNGVNVSVVNLFPVDVNSKSYHTVKLYIDNVKTELVMAEIYGKEGDVYTYKIKTFLTNQSLPAEMFVFNKTKYPGVMVNDLR